MCPNNGFLREIGQMFELFELFEIFELFEYLIYYYSIFDLQLFLFESETLHLPKGSKRGAKREPKGS